jgi:hypothetical protein
MGLPVVVSGPRQEADSEKKSAIVHHKGYWGIIKSFNPNTNMAVVELSATMARPLIPISHLRFQFVFSQIPALVLMKAGRTREGLQPLPNTYIDKSLLAPSIPDKTFETDRPQTPMPGPSSSNTPAWDPSSQTPLSHGAPPDISGMYSFHTQWYCILTSLQVIPADWILAPELQYKSFAVVIKNSTGLGGFEWGVHEGVRAAFRGPGEPGMARIHLQLRLPRTIEIPTKFVVPIKPFKKVVGGKAIVIFGENIGSEVVVKSMEGSDWTVWDPLTSSLSICSSDHLAALPLIA